MDNAPELETFPFQNDTVMELGTRFDDLLTEDELTRVRLPYGGDAWLATRMDHVRQVLSDTRFSRSALPGRDTPRYTPEVLTANSVLVGLDPPEHTRIRRLLSRALTNRLMDGMRPWIRETVQGILTGLLEQGPPVDLVPELGDKVPRLTVCELLGMPYSDRDRFDGWVDAVFSMAHRSRDEVGRAWSNLSAYIGELVELRRSDPKDDLITALVDARNGDDRLSDREIITNATAILVAGYESTATLITNMAYVVMTHPGLRSSLFDDPSRVPDAVEEMLRYIALSPAAATNHATDDVEIGETIVRRGESVVPCVSSANYDESVFGDARCLDIDREAKGKHLTFGFGPHFCMGARLARIELQEVLTGLLERTPDMRLAVNEKKLPRKPWLGIRGFTHLPVTW